MESYCTETCVTEVGYNDLNEALYACHEFIRLYSNDTNSYEFDVVFQLIGAFLHRAVFVFRS